MDLDILLPFHNADNFFWDALNSLKKIRGVKANIVLIDDRQDNYKNLDFSFLKNVEYVRTTGGVGYGEALRIGSTHLSSEVVALFNSDDLVDPSRFIKQINELSTSEVNHCAIQRITKSGKIIRSLTGNFSSNYYDPILLLLGSYVANATWCMRRDWWDRNAFFDSEDCLDWRIALRAFHQTKISYIHEPLYFYRKHPHQVTSNRNISPLKLQNVYLEWSALSKTYEIPESDYSVFSTLALPWQRYKVINLSETKLIAEHIYKIAQNIDIDLAINMQALIYRRYLLALRQRTGFVNKVKLIALGRKEIFNFLEDILTQVQK